MAVLHAKVAIIGSGTTGNVGSRSVIFYRHEDDCGTASLIGICVGSDRYERKKAPWKIRLEHETAKFVAGWDWERVLFVWRNRVGDFGVDVEQLFSDISVHDPKYLTGREPFITWCPINELAEYRKELQRHYDAFPGAYGSVKEYIGNKGEHVTLTYLSKARHNLSSLVGILIAASLFSRMGSTRERYPDTWPNYHCVEPLLDMALAQFGEKRFPWHYSSTRVLPASNYD